MYDIQIKRIYEPPSKSDGYRLLIDRIWPRGISKDHAKLDKWMKEIAPSTELRKWFGHIPDKFDEFRKRYREEINKKEELFTEILDIAKKQKLTLLYGAKDEKHNQAIVLKEALEEHS